MQSISMACEPLQPTMPALGSIHTILGTLPEIVRAFENEPYRAILDAPGVKGQPTFAVPPQYGLTETMQSIIFKHQKTSQEPFYVLDLGKVRTLMDRWTRNLPMVTPFYAFKCNPGQSMVGALAAVGANFDCASQAEIESVLALGVSPDRIIYANPCKQESHIRYAASIGVNVTTFDSVEEVEKIRKWHPKCALVIRVKAPDEGGARIKLGSKFGALPEEITPLLQAARAVDLPVVGVSFHVGGEAMHFNTYEKAIALARSIFDTAVGLGMPPMNLLNIGGGFTAGPTFEEACSAVKAAIQTHFPEGGLTVIAEPGRYFAETAFTLATNIIGKRVRGEVREYWINDGVYGSMNRRLCDHEALSSKCVPLACMPNRVISPTCEGAETFRSTVFGPTCDSYDMVTAEFQLPELQVGDWLVFPNMGAYSAAALGSNFNGYNASNISTYVAY